MPTEQHDNRYIYQQSYFTVIYHIKLYTSVITIITPLHVFQLQPHPYLAGVRYYRRYNSLSLPITIHVAPSHSKLWQSAR